MIKLIVFDVDNTLAVPGKGILASDIEKIKKLENNIVCEKFHKFLLSNGI